MIFFKKLYQRFLEYRARKRILEEFSDLDEVLLDKRLEILDEIATPLFAEIGLKNWNGRYIWSSNFNEEGIKHVVEYNVLRHYKGTFSFGNCFQEIPSISGRNKFVNHRTEKSVGILYYNRTEAAQKALNNWDRKNMGADIVSTANEVKFRSSLQDVLSVNVGLIGKWFSENKTIDQNIAEMIKEKNNPPFEIGKRIITPDYVLAFLYKMKNNHELSELSIDSYITDTRENGVSKELFMDRVSKVVDVNSIR